MLPRIRSIEDYRKIYADSAVWLPAAEAIATRHGLPGKPERQPLGTHLVFRCGDNITLKIFCPLWPQDFEAEKAALTCISGMPVPSVIDSGEFDGWPWLVMKRLPGVPAVEVWPSLPEKTKLDVIVQIGRWMRELHRSPQPSLMAGKWEAFIRERKECAETHHAMPEPWRSWIREQLRDFVEPPMTHVLLHADITADHILLSRVGAGDSAPTIPEPVTPEPVTPEPVTPEPVTPESVTPEPVTPESVTPEPVMPKSVTPEPDPKRCLSSDGSARTGPLAISGSATTPAQCVWIPTGLIDFGDARVGHPFYEFIAPLAFYTFGAPDRSMTLLRSYGLNPSPELFRILTRYCLLHEFGTIRSFIETFPADTPDDFIHCLWG